MSLGRSIPVLLLWAGGGIEMILADLLQDQNPWWRDGAIRRARGYPVRRELQPKILNRILRMDDRRATVLLGPRQVGKTVLLLQLADDLLAEGLPAQNLTYFDFSDERITGEIMAHEVVEALPVGVSAEYPRVFLFDEIRSAPKWDLWLKRAVDARVGRIVATDSAARLLRDGTQESGQGRWDEIYIEGLTFREFVQLHGGPEQDVEKVLRLAPNLHERYLALGGCGATSRSGRSCATFPGWGWTWRGSRISSSISSRTPARSSTPRPGRGTWAPTPVRSATGPVSWPTLSWCPRWTVSTATPPRACGPNPRSSPPIRGWWPPSRLCPFRTPTSGGEPSKRRCSVISGKRHGSWRGG